jgi:hypothetical protein
MLEDEIPRGLFVGLVLPKMTQTQRSFLAPFS